MSQPLGESRLKANSIGLTHIVFFVIAAAAPMTAVVGATPPAFAFGSGAGVPGAFILAGALYLLFSISFTAMSRHVASAGAFYSYISLGLGRSAGISGALIALMAYFAVQIGIFALFAVFMAQTMAHIGIVLPWWVWSMLALGIVVLCGRRNIELSARLLGLCMIAEIAILLLLDVAILFDKGFTGISLAGFMPGQVFSPGLGVTMVFVLGSYVGFEATTIFGEEAHTPERTIPLATYISVLIITVFYAFSTWAIVQFHGADHVRGAAASSLDSFYFNAAEVLLGKWAVDAMNLLLLTSLFACLLSFHNTLNRYLYTLSRKELLWQPLSRIHERHGSPHVAGLFRAALAAIVIVTFSIAGAEPYATVFAWMSALAVLGIVSVQVLVSCAVLSFFRPSRHERVSRLVPGAAALSAAGLAAAFVLISVNLGLLTGSSNPVVLSFPAIVIAVGACGLLVAHWLRRNRPEIYLQLGQADF